MRRFFRRWAHVKRKKPGEFPLLVRSSPGMTLTELLAGLALSLLLFGAAASLLGASTGAFTRQTEQAFGGRVTETAERAVAARLAFAWDAGVGREPEEGCRVLVFGTDGRLRLDGQDLFSEAFYGDGKLYCRAEAPEKGESPYVLHLALRLETESGKTLSSEEIVVKLVNTELWERPVRCREGGGLDSGEEDLYISFREEPL